MVGLLLASGFIRCAAAGVMTHAMLEKEFPAPLQIGHKDADTPVWPVFRQNGTAIELVAYLFESIDLAPVPGFAGVPFNLLVALDANGVFMDVRVISQHEPVFLDGLGEAPMHAFVSQYRGLSLTQNIAIDSAPRDRAERSDANVTIDGVAKATASVRIINQSLLSAALRVARSKLGYAGARDPDQVARVRHDLFEPIEVSDAKTLITRGLVQRLMLTNAEVERAFQDSAGAGLDPEALARPEEGFIDMQVAYVSVPSIGRNLLDQASWRRLVERLEPNDHALLLRWNGRYGPVSEHFIAGTVPDRLVLAQGGLPIEMRDLDIELALRPDLHVMEGAGPVTMKAFRIISHAGLDPSMPLDLTLRVTRLKGMIYPERIGRDFALHTRLPERFYTAATGDNKSWMPLWKQRRWELAGVVAGLALLFTALTMQRVLTVNGRRFAWFRLAFLGYTLFFLGWIAQGQLSIVTITGVLQALGQGRDLGFLLYDPVSLLLWAGVVLSLFIWGRGTFCGWLCPFGALQEFSAHLGKWLGLPRHRFGRVRDAKLMRVKYLVLAVIVGSAFVSPGATDSLVEVEPFKTAITLNFARTWPFVAYAGGLLLAGTIYYKFFCRYLCPLGAGLALFGRLRLVPWLPRRAQCGTPCQTCRHRCEYAAIKADGTIRYDECFQCMDCVVIFRSDEKCAPLMLEKKRSAAIPMHFGS